ncbi:MAG TPA: iron ABC transporter permease [Chloroflexota bacterium]|nr:iron ABC transporter permease [Chloroflexota bacterium]
MAALSLSRKRERNNFGFSHRWLVNGAPVAVGIVVALPLLLLLANSFNTAAPGQPATYSLRDWVQALTDQTAIRSFWYTAGLGAVRIAVALPIGFTLAWLIGRTDMPGRGVIELLCWMGIFLPVLPLTFGWILLLDPQFGLVNLALQKLPFIHGAVFNVYSFWGIVWVHLASTTPYYMVILLLPALRRVGAALEEAARVCGASQFRTILKVTMPVLTPAILGVTLLTFVRSLESFEVELVIGKPAGIAVYSTRIYDLVHDQPPGYGESTVLGFVVLVVMLGLAWFYQRAIGGRSYATVTGKSYSAAPARLGRRGWLASGLCFGYLGIALGAPLGFLVLGSFMRRYGFFQLKDPFTTAHWHDLFTDPVFFSSVRNSLIIALGVAVLVIVVYSLVAYRLVRGPVKLARVTELLLWVPWAVPGILMSLGLLWLFLGTPLRVALYGSLLGIIVAIAIKESPFSTLFFKAGLLQIGVELEECARVGGASWLHTYRRVLLPLLAPTAITVGLLSFLSAIRDISTTVLLYSPQSRPISILMLEYSFAGEMERGAAIGVLVTAFVLVVTIGARALGFRMARERV